MLPSDESNYATCRLIQCRIIPLLSPWASPFFNTFNQRQMATLQLFSSWLSICASLTGTKWKWLNISVSQKKNHRKMASCSSKTFRELSSVERSDRCLGRRRQPSNKARTLMIYRWCFFKLAEAISYLGTSVIFNRDDCISLDNTPLYRLYPVLHTPAQFSSNAFDSFSAPEDNRYKT